MKLIKQGFSIFKKILPLVPIFGGWKAATVAFAILQFGAPMALKFLNEKKAELETRNA